MLQNDGKPQHEIAKFLSCSHRTVAYWCMHGEPDNLVYAALAYYYANQEAMEQEIAQYQAECQALETQWRSGNIA